MRNWDKELGRLETDTVASIRGLTQNWTFWHEKLHPTRNVSRQYHAKAVPNAVTPSKGALEYEIQRTQSLATLYVDIYKCTYSFIYCLRVWCVHICTHMCTYSCMCIYTCMFFGWPDRCISWCQLIVTVFKQGFCSLFPLDGAHKVLCMCRWQEVGLWVSRQVWEIGRQGEVVSLDPCCQRKCWKGERTWERRDHLQADPWANSVILRILAWVGSLTSPL